MIEDRLQALETLVAHHERQIQDLSELVMEQRREIDVLVRRLEKTQVKLLEIEEGGTGAVEDKSLSVTEQALRDKPPHY